jgi:exonuclease 1
LAYLNRTGIVDFIISEDSDLLAFGCKRVLFKLDQNGQGEEICSVDFQDNSEISLKNWNPNMFLYMCIISGCDYLSNIKG